MSSLFSFKRSPVTTSVKLSKDEYIEWYSLHRKELGINFDTLDYSYFVNYIPNEVEVLTMVKGKEISGRALDSLLTVKSPYSFFEFSMFNRQNSNKDRFRKGIASHHALFELQEDFSLVADDDTLTCVWAEPMRERLDITGEMVYRLGFEKLNEWDNVRLYYHDRLFDSGTREFSFKNTLANLPSLK